nr:retrovirus-related Pol polyprotein from transposon TNT 1-94 [Tanacetum cinerariifolium]
MTLITSLCEMACNFVQKKLEEKRIEEEQATKAQTCKLSDDDDDEESSNSLNDNISKLPPYSAIIPDEPVLSTKEPDNSLSMGDEHLDTISITKSDEFIKSGVENLIPIPSESEVPVISNPEPYDNHTIDELPQALPILHPTSQSEAESPFTFDSTPTYVDESPNVFNLPPQPSKLEEKQLEEEQAAKAQDWKPLVCCDDDDDEESSKSLKDNIISELPLYSAVTPNEPVDSLIMRDEHLDTIMATESDEFIKAGVENLIPIPSESEGIPEHVCDVPFHDNSPPLDVSDSELVSSEVMEIVIPEVGGIKASNDNPIPSYDPSISGTPPNLTPSGESDFFSEVDAFLAVEDKSTSSQFPNSYLDPEGDMLLFEEFLNDDHSSESQTKSSSTSLNSLLEETNNFHNSLPECTTFSHVLCNAECEFDSSDDQSPSDEDVLEKTVSKPLSEEEIIPMESLRTHDSSLPISSKIDSLLDEFVGELTLLKSIPPGIDETDCDFEKNIRLIEKLLYDNSSPRPPEEFVSAKSDAATESFSPSPILVKDSESLMEEIDLFSTLDYPMPPGIKDEDSDSERDILIPKDLSRNNSLSFVEKESFHFDIPPFSRPPAKPPDGDTGILNIKMMGDISDQKAFMHQLMITLASHQEKSLDLLSHRCETVKKFNTHRSHLNTCPIRSRADPTLLNDFEMAAEGIGNLPVPDLWTMEELYQPSLNGQGGLIALIAIQATNFGLKNDMIQQGGLIALIAIQATNFGLKNDMIQQVQNSCKFHGLPGGTFMKRRSEECYDLIENITAHHKYWDTSSQRSESSSSISSSSDTEGAYQGNSHQPQGNRILLSYRSDNYLGPPVYEDEYRFIFGFGNSPRLKKYLKNDKIGSKPDKNEKRGEAGKKLKQLQWIKEEKLSKTQKEWSKTQTRSRVIQSLKKKRREQRPYLQFLQKPKKVIQALIDPSRIEAIQDELIQFKLQQVWTLVDLPIGKRAIGTKWIYRNKKNKRGIMVRNKTRLVEHGYTQKEEIVYDEIFALVARIEAIRLFLAYASFKDLVLYQMDVNSAFLYGKIGEKVYVCQPLGFKDLEFLAKFIRKEMCIKFKKMMHKKFQMSSIGELTFFLGLQTASTPMKTSKPLMMDENAEDVDVHLYRSMIGSLILHTNDDQDKVKQQLRMELRLTRAYTYYCQLKVNVARHKLTTAVDINAVEEQFWATVTAKNINGEAHIHAKVDGKKVTISEATIRRDLKFEDEGGVDCLSNEVIFEQLPLMGTKFLMYLRFVQVFLDKQVEGMLKHNAIYVMPSHTKKVFSNMRRVGKDVSRRDTPLFPIMLVPAQEEDLGEGSTMPSAPQHTPIIQPLTSKPQKKQKPRKPRRHDTQETQPSDPTDEALNEENVPVQSNGLRLLRFNTLKSREDNLKLNELIELYTKLFHRVLNLEIEKTAQAKEISSLKKRVKRLEKKKRSGTHRIKRLYKVGLSARVKSSAEEQSLGEEDASKQGRNIADIDADAEITLVDEIAEDQGRYNDQEMFNTNVLKDKEVVVEDSNAASIAISTAAATLTVVSIDDITLAQALVEIKKSTPKARAMMDANYKLAVRLQEEEQGELTIEEKSRLFVELMDKRKKHFAKLRVEDKRRKPPTKAQKRNQMCVYLKNIDDGYDVTIDATPSSIKTPIIDYKIYKEGKKSYFRIFKADENSQMYYTFSKMLKNLDREDLEVL